jgi:NADPH2:quinone reductase
VRCVTFTGAGGNEVIEVTDRPDPQPVGREVVVAVRVVGLNPADVLQREGRYPAPPGWPPDIPGLEVAGEVVACGPGVRRWRDGDRVFGIVGGGGLATRVLADERSLAAIPEGLDGHEAAAVPEVFVTAHDALRTQAGLSSGQVLLVHGASGGVGSAAVQLGVAFGARTLGAARSEDGRRFVTELGAHPIHDDRFVDAVLEETAGRGADVILELVGTPHFPGDLDAVAVGGCIMVVGIVGGTEVTFSLLQLMQRRCRLQGTVLRARSNEEKGAAVAAFEAEMVPLLADQTVRPIIDHVYPLPEIGAAFERLTGSGKRGKVLVELDGRKGRDKGTTA